MSNKAISFVNPKSDFNKNRILCSLIPKDLINISYESIIEAMTVIKNESLADLKNIKREDNVANGREYALKAQLHINANIGIEKFKKVGNKN